MALARGNFSICLNNGFIFCFGGDTNVNETITTSIVTSCEKYDIADDQWYIIADLPFPLRNNSACSVSADSIYLFGGEVIKMHESNNETVFEAALNKKTT